MPGIRAGEQVGTAVGGHRSVDETLGDGALAGGSRREPTVRPESGGR